MGIKYFIMITGWVKNNGEFIECERYEHFNVNDEDLNSLWEEYKTDIQRALDSCNELAEMDEHPEWHHYEMAQSDGESAAYFDAYCSGYLRVTNYSRGGGIPMIAIEGLEKYIEGHKIVIKELADKYNCKIKTFIINENGR